MKNQRSLERLRQKGLDARREVRGRSLGANTTRQEDGDNTNPYGYAIFMAFSRTNSSLVDCNRDNVQQGKDRSPFPCEVAIMARPAGAAMT